MVATSADELREVRIGPVELDGTLGVPRAASGLVIFAHGSGSGRLSPRNNRVAAGLRDAGLATLLLDLLRPAEEVHRANVFDIELLASRLLMATRWARTDPEVYDLPIGYFGASTGAAAALVAAADPEADVAAVVSRGGRPDLAGEALKSVEAPTLLVVGGADAPVINLNRMAYERMHCARELVIVPDAGHLFEEPGTLDLVMEHATRWFRRFLRLARAAHHGHALFHDRRQAGERLAQEVTFRKLKNPIVLALPRGGVPVGFEVAKALRAPLDVVLTRKIGAPGHPELGLGAVVDGPAPQVVLNESVVRLVGADSAYVQGEMKRQLAEIERRRRLYHGDRPPPKIEGRTVIVVDDGIATGGTVRAVLQALRKTKAVRIVLAVPVAPRDSIHEVEDEADDVICLATPEPFLAVGAHYEDFTQTSDEEVIELLASARAFAAEET